MTRWALFFVFLIALTSLFMSAEGATLIGVLEEPQCQEDAGTFVRALYAKKDRSWISLDAEDKAQRYIAPIMSWVIAFNGRKVGNVKTVDPGFDSPYAWTYPRDRLLNLAPGQSLPHFPNKTKQFYGWCQAPDNRPLVLVSEGRVSDPDRWKPVKASDKELLSLFNSFKVKAGPALFCPNGSETRVPFNYTVKDVEALRSYKDKDRRRLITVRLKRPKDTDTCDGPIDPAWDTYSFLLTKKIVCIGSGLDLVDAGDYDNDGHSEALFWFTGYNKDGYMLFFDNFTSKIEYLWNYH